MLSTQLVFGLGEPLAHLPAGESPAGWPRLFELQLLSSRFSIRLDRHLELLLALLSVQTLVHPRTPWEEVHWHDYCFQALTGAGILDVRLCLPLPLRFACVLAALRLHQHAAAVLVFPRSVIRRASLLALDDSQRRPAFEIAHKPQHLHDTVSLKVPRAHDLFELTPVLVRLRRIVLRLRRSQPLSVVFDFKGRHISLRLGTALGSKCRPLGCRLALNQETLGSGLSNTKCTGQVLL